MPEAVALPYASKISSPLHSGIGVRTYYSLFTQAALFPLTAGTLLYGWRALGTILVVILAAIAAAIIWRRIGRRGWQVRISHCVYLALLLALMLPAHLFSNTPGFSGEISWPLLPAAGLAVVMFSWLLGGMGAERVHPSLAAILVLFVLFGQTLTPHRVLRVDRLFAGDLMRGEVPTQMLTRKIPWTIPPPKVPGSDIIAAEPASDKLFAYTSGEQAPDRASMTPQMLIRDQMPPLEDLIIGGQPGPIGTSSAIAVIVGGLFSLFHGMIDYRVPLLGTLAAMATLLILPIPVLISETSTQWQWLAFREHYLGWPTAITFVNYEILASPLLFTLFFLASASSIRPITKRGRAIFAILLGILAAVFQLYESVAIGPYVALLIVCLLTPALDHLLGPRTLV